MKTIFLHGLGQTPSDWEKVIRLLPCLDYDRPNLFDLGKSRSDYQDILEGLEQRLNSCKEDLCLCGISLGAILALDYALRHKDKVKTIILIAAQYKMPKMILDFQNIVFSLMPEASFKSIGMTKKQTKELIHSMRDLNFGDRLASICCPAQIVCGKKDHANLKASEKLSKLIPNAHLHIISDTGHEVNTLAPDIVADIVKKALLTH